MVKGDKLYDAAASFGKALSSVGFLIALACVIITCGIATYLVFRPLKEPDAPSPLNDEMTNKEWNRSLGIILSIIAVCVLCLTVINMQLTHRYKGYAAASGVGSLLVPFT